MVKRSEAVQVECEALLDLVDDIGEMAQRIQAAAAVDQPLGQILDSKQVAGITGVQPDHLSRRSRVFGCLMAHLAAPGQCPIRGQPQRPCHLFLAQLFCC